MGGEGYRTKMLGTLGTVGTLARILGECERFSRVPKGANGTLETKAEASRPAHLCRSACPRPRFAAFREQLHRLHHPARKSRDSRFYGSHTGAAWLVLFMIFNVIWTMFLFRGAVEARDMGTSHGYGKAAFVSYLLGKVLPEDLLKYGLIPEFVGKNIIDYGLIMASGTVAIFGGIGDASLPPPNVTAPDSAQFISNDVPTTMTANQTYPVTITMKNTSSSKGTPNGSRQPVTYCGLKNQCPRAMATASHA